MWTTELLLDWSRPMDEVRGVAQQMQFFSIFPKGILSWSDFASACDRIPAKTWRGWRNVGTPEPLDATNGLGGMRFADVQFKRDLLKANFNPNSDLNKFNPGPALSKMTDKSDLLRYSTEFSFQPAYEHELECVGRVLDARGHLVASRTFKTTVSSFRQVRLGTQRELVCGSLGDLDRAGDEGALRMPGATAFVSQSQGAGRTWGHRLDTRTPNPGTWLDGDSQGLSLQTYPEPCGTSGLAMAPADYDGNLQLATVETAADAWYGVSASSRDMKLLARWDDGFNLDLADGASACSPDLMQTPATSLGLWSAFKPGTLYPDGCYSEWGACPAYPSAGNAHGVHGLMSFWVKPSYDQTNPANCPRSHRYVRWTNHSTGAVGSTSPDQLFFLGNTWGVTGCQDLSDPNNVVPNGAGGAFAAQFETGHQSDDADLEHRFSAGVPPVLPWMPSGARGFEAHRWKLLTFAWDLRSPNKDDCGTLVVDAGNPAQFPLTGTSFLVTDYGDQDIYPYMASNAPAQAADLTLSDRNGAHHIVLGPRYPYGPDTMVEFHLGALGGADSTFDEFAIYDFGGAGPNGTPAAEPAALSAAATLASARYKEGRYYAGAAYFAADDANPDRTGEAASFLTAPIRLPAGSVLKRVLWTWYRPAELPTDYAAIELTDTGGTSYLWEPDASRSRSAGAWRLWRQDWDVNRDLPGEFRARVVFRRETPLAADTPVLESPVLDDLTFVYLPPGGPRLLSWQEGD